MESKIKEILPTSEEKLEIARSNIKLIARIDLVCSVISSLISFCYTFCSAALLRVPFDELTPETVLFRGFVPWIAFGVSIIILQSSRLLLSASHEFQRPFPETARNRAVRWIFAQIYCLCIAIIGMGIIILVNPDWSLSLNIFLGFLVVATLKAFGLVQVCEFIVALDKCNVGNNERPDYTKLAKIKEILFLWRMKMLQTQKKETDSNGPPDV